MIGCIQSKLFAAIRLEFKLSPEPKFGEYGFSKRRGSMRAQAILCMVGFSLALGAAEARAAPVSAGVQPASHSGGASHDLGVLPVASRFRHPNSCPCFECEQRRAHPRTANLGDDGRSLPGLGLATLKRGRTDRLSPGIE